MKLKEGFVLREIAGDTVVIPSGNTLNFDMMITLNETATFLWKKLENGAEENELVEALLREYEVDSDTAKLHVSKLVAKLSEYELLE